MMTTCPTWKRQFFAFLMITVGFPALSQEDCDNIVTIPELAAQIEEWQDAYEGVQVDTVILQPDGSYEVQLSNGNTFEQVHGCTDPAYIEYDPAANTDDGSCATLEGCTASDVASMDGYNYGVVQIGGQCWFAENLRTTTYADGTAIPAGLTDGAWTSTTSGATAVYGEGSSECYNYSPDIDACDEAQSLSEYGRLYNWYAVDDARGLCPSGWHVPTDGEWMVLEMELGMSESEANSTLWRGTDEGAKLKSTSGWSDSGNGTDDFGFSALPGGLRHKLTGLFNGAGRDGYWWSSSENPSGRVYRSLQHDYTPIWRSSQSPRYGFSVRCLRDADFSPIQGCTDPAYIEFDPAANTDDGSCATLVVNGCTDPAYIEYDAAANTDDGSCTTLSCANASPTMDGYTYSVVEIGDQCWFAENLRTTVYADGSAIPEVTAHLTWSGLYTGARCAYLNDAAIVSTYGLLYNWYAVDNASGLCPNGWHVPTDGEWSELEDYITAQGFDGTEGTALKSTYGWSNSGNGTDDLGFSALPGGRRLDYTHGYFYGAGFLGYWWSSSPSSVYGLFRTLASDNPYVDQGNFPRRYGLSVRCLRDAD